MDVVHSNSDHKTSPTTADAMIIGLYLKLFYSEVPFDFEGRAIAYSPKNVCDEEHNAQLSKIRVCTDRVNVAIHLL